MEEQHFDKLYQLILENKTIEAKKYIRNVTGFDLKKTDELFETLCYDLSVWNKKNEIKAENELNEKELILLKKLLKDGQKLNAVKYVKNRLNISLKEAKELADALEEGPQKTETIIFGEDDSLIIEADIKDESYIEFGATDKPDSVTDSSENLLKSKKNQKRKKTILTKEAEPIIFEKFVERDKNKKRRRSNSGCMLMLTFMFLTALIIAGGIYLL